MLYLTAMMHQRAGAAHSRWRARSRRVACRLACAVAAVVLLPWPALAHEIPQRVAIRGFVQRDGGTLRLLLRVPLDAMRDVDFPLRSDGTLDLVVARPLLADAARVWLANAIRISADGRTLDAPRVSDARLALPNDRTFDAVASARASFQRPLLDSVAVQWQQLLLDVELQFALPDTGARLVLHPDLASLGIRTTSVLHIVRPDGRERTLSYEGNPPGVPLDPGWWQTAAQFVGTGFRHILDGADHILFICCLVLGIRGVRSLVATVTAFTVAHSLTLIAAALGAVPDRLWFPPLVEVLIAASIIWVAIENIVLTEARLAARWAVAFVFGLVHGFGFSFALADRLQFAGENLVSALLAFNVGVELGQVTVLAAAVPLLWLLRRYVGAGRERLLTIALSVVVAHTAWHWMTDRGATLAAHRVRLAWPTADAAGALVTVRLALLAAVALAVALSMRQILRVSRRT